MVLYATRPKTLSPADPCNKVPPRRKAGDANGDGAWNAEFGGMGVKYESRIPLNSFEGGQVRYGGIR
jgi:hypothetical protein